MHNRARFRKRFGSELVKHNTFMIYCYCLMASGKSRPITWYRKRNTTFFILLVKMSKPLGILFIMKL